MNKLTNYIQEALVKKNTTVIQSEEYVDLGLPSGTKWATCNLGAEEPEEYGLYFAWGETEGFSADDVKSGKRSFDRESYQYAENPKTLPLSDDAAHVMLGGKWRIPTDTEMKELLSNCERKLETLNGVKGCRLISKINGNSIFIPLSGNCNGYSVYKASYEIRLWSSTLNSSYPSGAYHLNYNSSGFCRYNYSRNCGLAIRPVLK